jgi:hypothetical protein
MTIHIVVDSLAVLTLDKSSIYGQRLKKRVHGFLQRRAKNSRVRRRQSAEIKVIIVGVFKPENRAIERTLSTSIQFGTFPL